MEEKKSKKKLSKKKILLIVSLALLSVICISFGYIYYLLSKPNNIKIDENKLGINKETEDKYGSTEIKNIALFGIDAPKGVNGRSDAIMILSIDEEHKKIKLSSIMRDSYVQIEGYGKDKINHAYAFGGPELSINTLNKNVNLDIDSFVTVNFASRPKIINELGGVQNNITSGDLKYLNTYIGSVNSINKTNSPHIYSTGDHNLDGTQALAYARIRYDGGDQMRTQRQRNVIEGIFNKVIKMSPTKYPDLLNELLPLVDTNISPTEFLELGTDILSISPKKLYEARFPCDNHRKGSMINGVSYQTFNIDTETDEIHKFIFEEQ